MSYEILLREEIYGNSHVIVELNQLKLKVGSIYRDPSNHIANYLEYFDSLLERFPDCVWLTDTNFDLCNHFNILNEINVDSATYVHSRTGFSLIDHCFTDVDTMNFNCYVHPAGFSDHDAVLVNMKPISISSSLEKLRFRTDYDKISLLIEPLVATVSDMDDLDIDC